MKRSLISLPQIVHKRDKNFASAGSMVDTENFMLILVAACHTMWVYIIDPNMGMLGPHL